MAERPKNEGPVWDAALGWLLRVQESPDDPALRRSLETWLREDPAHAAAWRKAEETWRIVGAATPAHVAEPVASSRIPAPAFGTARAGRRSRRNTRRWAMAAGLVAASLAFLLAAPDAVMRLRADHATGMGELRAVALQDGSRVTLSAGSAIATSASSTSRGVSLLAGEAYFEVAKDRARPFSVVADEVAITVTGTAFDVRRGEDTVSVAVREGAVRIQPGATAGSVALGPGDRLTYSTTTGAAARDRIPPSRIAMWRDRKVVVEHARISDVVARIAPFHRGAVFVVGDALRNRLVSGVYDLRNPAGALRAAVQPHGGTVHALTPYLTIVTGGGTAQPAR